MAETEVGRLVEAAAQGNQDAWNALVRQLAGVVWSVARAHRLSHADASDVHQTTWLKLVEHLRRIDNPDRVAGWLATTARRECLAILRKTHRQIPTDDDQTLADPTAQSAPVDRGVLVEERDRTLWRCLEALSERCRVLLRVLMVDPPLSYEEVSATLDMPVGSIGPTRARCLDQLRQRLAAAGLTGLAC